MSVGANKSDYKGSEFDLDARCNCHIVLHPPSKFKIYNMKQSRMMYVRIHTANSLTENSNGYQLLAKVPGIGYRVDM